MSSERQLKKIDLQTLDNVDRKIAFSKVRSVALALAVVVLLAGGGYLAYLMVSGDVVASRFAVNKMYCPACVITLKEVTSKLPGVVEADVSLAAQDVIVKFRNKQTNPEVIQQAIAQAGYPAQADGMFKPAGGGINDVLVALVNGKPVFTKDIKLSVNIADPKAQPPAVASAFFSTVGKEILLQAADAATVVIQPSEIEEEVKNVAEKQGISPDEFLASMASSYGSKEKYLQIVGQVLGIRKLRDERVIEGVQNPDEKAHKTMEWVGKLFRDADVKILDAGFKQNIQAAAGQDDWKTFWPRMIAGDTELKTVLSQ
jgi:copper chaperone CopZ